MNEKVKEKDSNELLNIILMLFGAVFVMQGVIDILAWFSVSIPPWLGVIAGGSSEVMAVLGQNGIATTILGVWCFLAGLFMFQEQEFAWGQALVVLSIIFAKTVGPIINWFTESPMFGSFNVASFDTWINLFGCLMSIIFFIWLLVTKDRYT